MSGPASRARRWLLLGDVVTSVIGVTAIGAGMALLVAYGISSLTIPGAGFVLIGRALDRWPGCPT